MMPVLDTSPTVGRMPTIPWRADGEMIEPDVSVPIVAAARPAEAAAPEPDDEPLGLTSRSIGVSTWPPRPE